MAMKLAASVVFVSANLLSSAHGRALRNQDTAASGVMNAEDVKKTLLEEIEKNFASVGRGGRLARLEAALKPLFDSLPKNEHGNLGHSPVRYALHRIFVQRHGWYIKGLEPDGDSWNTTSPAGVLKDKVSSYVEELFEERLGGRGFNLHDTAVLAATLEHLIHDESKSRLVNAYNVKEISSSVDISRAQADAVLDEYMKFHLLSDDMASRVSEKDMFEIFPGWTETKQFVRDIRSEVERTTSGKFSFTTMNKIVEEVAERFGHFQDAECSAMKTKLIGAGDGGIGRVPLADFYGASMADGSIEFQESEGYLRELGALDDTDPSHPSVIIPNYIQSATNCIASESLYSVCCLNECEQLLAHLEKEIDAPEAQPGQVAAIVASLSSSTVEAPRDLSSMLLEKLDEAAGTHGGTVQLHGRLFGQWMHHAFPRECPFPHVSGSISPATPDEWMAEKGQESFASKADMSKYTAQAKPKPKNEVRELNLWHPEEELLVPFPAKSEPKGRSAFWFIFSVVMLSTALISVASRAAAPVKAAKAALESLSQPDEITRIKADMAWEEPSRGSSIMRLRSRGDRSYLPA